MKNKELYNIHAMLNFSKFKSHPDAKDPLASIQNAMILVAIGTNKRLIAQKIEDFETARTLPETFYEYEHQLLEITNDKTLSEKESSDKYERLKAEYPDLSAKYEEHSVSFKKLLNEDCDISFKQITPDVLIKANGDCALTKEQMDLLDFMITY